jgi:UDP-N-acetylmuramate: L-alanyl-gamma-D-glutamyl-meso-diaminopimelate ligase
MQRIHLIGICGTAMATLAALLKRKGHDVRGSDQNVYPPMSDFLAAEGIRTVTGYRQENITADVDLVIVGNAISRGNPELETVLERKIRYCSLPEAIRDQFLWGARSLVFAGTHGKTTTTSLAGWLLTHGGLDPTVLVGGIALNLGGQGSSYRVGRGRDFVIEGDEYDSAFFDKTAKFLKYLPDVAVISNIEFDHADIYADLDAVRLAFRRLVNLVPRNGLLVLGADSPDAAALKGVAASPVETFGLSDGADWQAYDVDTRDGLTHFKVRRRGETLGRFQSPLLGAHNVRNALAAIAVGSHVGLDAASLMEGLRAFKGIKRRLETVGVARGVTILDDFAHHPTAVRETLSALRTGYPNRRIWAVFEPRSASSCRRVFQEDFANAFGAADEVVVAAVFRSSLPESERLSAEQLVHDLGARGRSARYVPEVDAIIRTIVDEHREGDVVVLMSNGAFGGIHQKLLKALAAEPAAFDSAQAGKAGLHSPER